MQFRILRTELLDGLNKVSRAVSNKSPLPILLGIKFDLTDTGLTLTGSDSDIAIQTFIVKNEKVLDIVETGAIVLNGRYICDIIRKLDSEYVDIETIDGTLTRIRGAKSDFKLNGIKAYEYPNLDLSKKGEPLKMDALSFKTIISQTVFAVSNKEARPILTGVNFDCKNGQLTCVATDSYRLSKKTATLDEGVNFNITIPSKSLQTISHIIEKATDLEIYVSSSKILVDYDNTLLSTRLIDGKYPDTSRLLPETSSSKLQVDLSDILNALSLADVLADDKNYVTMTLNEEEVVFTTSSQSNGSSKNTLSSALYVGEPLEITCTSTFLSDAIRAISQDTITLAFSGEMRPFILKSEKDPSLLQLVLPVRTV